MTVGGAAQIEGTGGDTGLAPHRALSSYKGVILFILLMAPRGGCEDPSPEDAPEPHSEDPQNQDPGQLQSG